MGFGESSALRGIGAVAAEVVAAYSGNKCGRRVCGQRGWTTVFDEFLIALLHLASCCSVIVTRLAATTSAIGVCDDGSLSRVQGLSKGVCR